MCFNPSGTAELNKECPKCGTNQDAINEACEKCGYEFPEMRKKRKERACPECGLEQPITNRRCSQCGAIMKAAGPKGPR
jgi:ribosomal protein S27AE